MGDERKSLESMGYPRYYALSSGKIFNIDTGYELRGSIKNGFVVVHLTDNQGKAKHKKIHKIIAVLFLKENGKPFVTHIDQNIENNSVINLIRVTSQEIKEIKGKEKKGKTIFQYNPDGFLVNKWDSMKHVAEYTNVSKSTITRVVREGRLFDGFFWRRYEETLENEIWRIVPFDELMPLLASNKGRIKSENGIMEGSVNSSGYVVVGVSMKNSTKSAKKSVHRLVLAAFEGRNDDLSVNHKDRCKSNNKIENLEYMTIADNLRHAAESGRRDFKIEPHRAKHREITQTDKEGNVRTFRSIHEASRETGIARATIRSACSREGHMSKGFIWKDVEKTE